MQQKGFVKYIVFIAIILVFVFLSQQIYFKNVGQNLISAATSQGQAQLSKGSNWANANIISKIMPATQNGGETIKTTDNKKEINNSSENILKKTENYFAGVANSITKPGTPQNCPAVTTPSK
jgi:hypothetical protein